MVKYLLIALLLVGLLPMAYSQNMTLGVTSGYVTNRFNFDKSSSPTNGYGFEANAWFNPQKKLHFGLTAGYYRMQETSFSNIQSSPSQMIPLMGGIEYQFWKGQRMKPFVGVETGVYLYQNNGGINDINNNSFGLHYGFSPNMGMAYALTGKISLNTRVRYGGMLMQYGGYSNIFSVTTGVTVDLNGKK